MDFLGSPQGRGGSFLSLKRAPYPRKCPCPPRLSILPHAPVASVFQGCQRLLQRFTREAIDWWSAVAAREIYEL